MTLLDWALLVVWLGVTFGGFWKGAVRIMFGGGGLIVGLWLAVVAGSDAAEALQTLVGVDWLAEVVGRLLLLLVCVVVGLVAGWGIERTLHALHLGWLNRLSGAALAGAVGVLLLTLFLVTAIRLSPTFEDLAEESVLAPRLLQFLGWAATQDAAAEAVSAVSDSITR